MHHVNKIELNRIVIAVAGMGTVGSGVAELLDANQDWIRRRSGKEIVLKTVLELPSNHGHRPGTTKNAHFTLDIREVVEDPEINVFVELVGGTTFALDYIRAALKAGKHVVTANKKLLAEHGTELFSLAMTKKLHLGFEASVAGGIPLLTTIKESLAANRTKAVIGILNGTANFILTEMTTRKMKFDQALQLAQKKGLAEADPTLDVDGWDVAHKLILLIKLAFGRDYSLAQLKVTGIRTIMPMDISYARDFGYRIKLLAMAREVEGHIEAGVFPALIPEHCLLASVDGSFNAVRLDGNAGSIMIYGHGAGALPTASAVLADIIAIGMNRPINNIGFVDGELLKTTILDLDTAISRHYVRVMVPDRPGVLRDIGGIMAKHNISLAQVVQKGKNKGMGVPIVFLTHKAMASDVHAAIADIDVMVLNLAKTIHYRIL
ncbi:homoserine dehydrogenase [Desulfovibrionales bacterium]